MSPTIPMSPSSVKNTKNMAKEIILLRSDLGKEKVKSSRFEKKDSMSKSIERSLTSLERISIDASSGI